VREASAGPDGLRVGQLVEVTVDKDVYRGRGLARLEGRVVFVPRAHAGDRIRGRIREVRPGWAEATLVEVLSPAKERRASPCPYVPRCGGCAYQELGYEAHLRAKEAVLRESLARSGAAWNGPVGVRPSPERGWRLRASLHVAVDRKGVRVGLLEEGRHRVVDLDTCLQLSEATNETLRVLRGRLAERPGPTARVGGVDVLESPDGTTRTLTLSTTLRASEVPALQGLAAGVPGLTGFGVEAGRRLQWLHGSPHVEMSLLGLSIRVHACSFFQANRFLYEALARAVVERLEARGRVLDLYAGVGLFALPLAARGLGVVAVERAPTAVADARANARRLGFEGLRVVRDDVRGALAAIRPEGGEGVILDPPRGGVDREVVDLVGARRPQSIVYVSCDPPTLGRDLARFAARGYHPDHVELFDMFPDTFHVETVVRLRPA
jgi:23S rRNA (uracil1939-C5)-methyltransferase